MDGSGRDAIFVFAGREDRKAHGLALYRSGLAPRLVLSVGRFEWRRFAALGLASDGGLTEVVPTIPAHERHFFVTLDERGVRCDPVAKGLLGTWSEARAFGGLAAAHEMRSVAVVSSREHLPRCLLALRALSPRTCTFTGVATGSSPEPVLPELLKRASYGILAVLTAPMFRNRKFER